MSTFNLIPLLLTYSLLALIVTYKIEELSYE